MTGREDGAGSPYHTLRVETANLDVGNYEQLVTACPAHMGPGSLREGAK